MPQPPPGEADLRALADRFIKAEAGVGVWLGEAAGGDRRHWLTTALEELAALRRMDVRKPVVTAYLHEHPKGTPTAVRDLAGSLALKLDRAAQSAADAARATFPKITPENIVEMVERSTVAYVDERGTSWSLGRWAEMSTTTIGRQATSRGVADAVGKGGKVQVQTGECDYCSGFEGEAVVGSDPLPPFHPSCGCVASPA